MTLTIPTAIAVMSLSLLAPAQAPFGIEWEVSLGGSLNDQARGACSVPTGYLVIGISGSSDGLITASHGQQEAWLTHIDESGVMTWQRALGGTSSDRGYGIISMEDGGCVFVGDALSNDGDVSGNHGGGDLWVVRLNSAGSIVWQRAFGGLGWDAGHAISVAPNGDYFVAGHTRSIGGDVTGLHGDGTASDCWVLRLSPEGQLIWQHALGGTQQDLAWGICALSDGGAFVVGEAGSQDGDVVGAHGGKDAWLCRLSPSGELLWSRAIGGSSDDVAYDVLSLPDGGAIVVGESLSNDGDVSGSHGAWDAWVIRVSQTGGVVWQRALGGTANDRFNSIAQVDNDRFLVAGSTFSLNGNPSGNHGGEDCWVALMDVSGVLHWESCFGGSQQERVFAIEAAPAGGAIFVGQSFSSDGHASMNAGQSDYWVVRLADFTGFAESVLQHARVSPNPAQGQVRVSLSSNLRAEGYINDMHGRLVRAFYVQGPEDWLPIEHLAAGAYAFRLVAGASESRQLLIIE